MRCGKQLSKKTSKQKQNTRLTQQQTVEVDYEGSGGEGVVRGCEGEDVVRGCEGVVRRRLWRIEKGIEADGEVVTPPSDQIKVLYVRRPGVDLILIPRSAYKHRFVVDDGDDFRCRWLLSLVVRGCGESRKDGRGCEGVMVLKVLIDGDGGRKKV
ncbi:hypothetical protein ACFE04_004883 [Oxalis oulophora]